MRNIITSTEEALISRGVPSDIARDLKEAGYTLRSLRCKKKEDLISLGISDIVSSLILSKRPSIPRRTLSKLLIDNKWTCCICRDTKLPIIVHHIDEWAKSKSHDISNLAVLCPNHHAMVHSHSALTINLDAKKLKDAKKEWEHQVKLDDSIIIRKAVQRVGEYWYYFNLVRIFEIAEAQYVNFKNITMYQLANDLGIINVRGNFLNNRNDDFYFFSGENSIIKYEYAKALFLNVLGRLSIENVSDRMDRSDLGSTLIRDDIIYIQGAHNFKRLNNISRGSGQDVQASRTANNIVLTYSFDRWFATSSSARSEWLSGRAAVGSFCRVGDIYRENGKVFIKCTVLAISNTLSDLKKRDYLNRTK